MKPILITGARGFIGRNLVRFLVDQNLPVVGIGHGGPGRWLFPFRSHFEGNELNLSGWLNGDVDFANLQQLSAQYGKFSAVIHLAGGSHVGSSFQNPAEDFQRTVQAGNQLLEWARLSNSDAPIVVVSSAAVYGAGHEKPIRETDNTNPFSPYGANKLILESLSRSYCENFGLKIAVARLFSVYGEGLEKQLIFDLGSKIAKSNSRIELGGTGNELRDWIHVDDVVRLLWMVKDKADVDCPVFNGGSGVGLTVAEVARAVATAWKINPEIMFSGDNRRGDPLSLVADTRRIAELGFQPEISFASGISRTVKWFQSEYQ